MFILSIVSAIIIGYICRGKISNLTSLRLEGIVFIFVAFLIEALAKLLLKQNIIEIGWMSYLLHLITYILLFIMVYKNLYKHSMKMIGIGFLLNAIVIFSNKGIMPVGLGAMGYLGIPLDTSLEGMYGVMKSEMNFKILADILPINLKKFGFILSIGDLFIILGIMMVIIQGMREHQNGILN